MILVATERISNSLGNIQQMIHQSKILAQAIASLVNAIKQKENDPDARRRQLVTAKSITDTTMKLIEATKVAARNPYNKQAQEVLHRAAEDLK